jgi:Curlin associated repeat
MRIATAAVIFLTIAACPASANEAFIAQLTNRVAFAEQAAASSVKTLQSSALLALPLQPKAIGLPALPTANPATNASALVQVGTNNFAAVSQTGGGNASSIVQRGNGNQASVTQRH